jgi:mycoredoxin
MTQITMYGADWCGDCRRSKRFLDLNKIAYEYVNVETDSDAAKRIVEINDGKKSIPVILFSDGSHLTEPSDNQLQEKLIKMRLM